MKYPSWPEFPVDEIMYGFAGGGIGVYRIDPGTEKITHTWPDLELSTPEEVEGWKRKIWEEGYEIPEEFKGEE